MQVVKAIYVRKVIYWDPHRGNTNHWYALKKGR